MDGSVQPGFDTPTSVIEQFHVVFRIHGFYWTRDDVGTANVHHEARSEQQITHHST